MKKIDSVKGTFNAGMFFIFFFLVFTVFLFQGTVLAREVSPEAREFLNRMSNDLSEVADVTKQNDVIEEVDRKPVKGLKDYENIVSKIRSSDTVLLLLYRSGGHIYITIKQSEAPRQ